MDVRVDAWFLILNHHSGLSKSWGAYQLKSILNCKEMKILPKFIKC